MNIQLQGEVALVTGASRGIGFACALELLMLGADMRLVARDEEHLLAMQAELEDAFPAADIAAFAADLADPEQRLDQPHPQEQGAGDQGRGQESRPVRSIHAAPLRTALPRPPGDASTPVRS